MLELPCNMHTSSWLPQQGAVEAAGLKGAAACGGSTPGAARAGGRRRSSAAAVNACHQSAPVLRRLTDLPQPSSSPGRHQTGRHLSRRQAKQVGGAAAQAAAA